MINGKTVLAIIPARGGSKGVPRKNIKPLAGRPLIAWTIEEAKKSKYIDRLILSSEDKEIIKVAEEFGCEVPFQRPIELAMDDTPGVAPILHALEQVPTYDYVMLLQPTSPLRSIHDIDTAIEKIHKNNKTSLVSVTESENCPYWMYRIQDNDEIIPFLNSEDTPVRRQDGPKLYNLNGAIYISTPDSLKKHRSFIQSETVGYLMPKERSLDIDSEFDFKLCEFMLNEIINNKSEAD
ncbi:cytidylyltransferase domain-containing protein [Lentibacillus saliphilus]|uniref:acylneuraminate cytidylyltransferase family protein n=1 Tax=Lentibacillus saliphilus TaxID=2737028 RepID=UPI001C2F490C|nr:acylneuraminate cytidylyltransferase family protein [Lentibacillus saliphilus]